MLRLPIGPKDNRRGHALPARFAEAFMIRCEGQDCAISSSQSVTSRAPNWIGDRRQAQQEQSGQRQEMRAEVSPCRQRRLLVAMRIQFDAGRFDSLKAQGYSSCSSASTR